MRRAAFGMSGHVTAKSSIINVDGNTGTGVFYKFGVYARKNSCLTMDWLLHFIFRYEVHDYVFRIGSDFVIPVHF